MKINFEELFEQTQTMIFSLGMRLFRQNQEDAMDFAQDVYLQAYNKLETFQGKSKPSTWLYSLALHLGLNKIKKEKRLKAVSTDNENFTLELPADSKDSPDQAVVEMLTRSDLETRVQSELAELPEAYRLPLILYYFEKLSYQEISANLGIPEGTIKSNVYRARLQLRDRLKEVYDASQ